MLDYSSTELISDEKIETLVEQMDVAPMVTAIWRLREYMPRLGARPLVANYRGLFATQYLVP